MKHLLTVLVGIVIVCGCQTKPKLSQQQKYTVHRMEMAVPSDLIKDKWPEQVWAQDPSHFKQDTIKADPVQYIGVKRLAMGNMEDAWGFNMDDGWDLNIEECQADYTEYTDVQVVSTAIGRMMEMPEIRISKLPDINLAEGERYNNDETETIELPIDYDVVDGKMIVTDMDTYRVGRAIDIHLIEVYDSIATYNLTQFFGQILGFDTYTLSNGDEIKIPSAQWSGNNTQYSQPLDTWYVVGGLTDELIEDGIDHLICAKITAD